MIDTHAHINFDVYDDDRDDLVKKSFSSGVSAIIIPGTTVETSRSALQCAHAYQNVYAGVGIHPTDVGAALPSCFEIIEEFVEDSLCVAVGEVGLDFYRDFSQKKEQFKALDIFFDLAEKKKKPLIIHNRSAEKEMESFLSGRSLPENPGVFHCFGSSVSFAKKVLDWGFFISFTGIVTFKNAQNLWDVVKYVPTERILLETDSPFLTPHPYRGKRNAPFYIDLVAKKVAELKNLSFEDVVSVTTKNAKSLFSFL